MHVLITGGTGTIGQRLVDHLLDYGYEITILSRRKTKPSYLSTEVAFAQWDSESAKGWEQQMEAADVVINLAGTGIADQRWSEERKQLIKSSRVQAGQAVVEATEIAQNKPQVLIQASAVGYYGGYSNNGTVLTEDSSPGNDFLSEVCKEWEASTEAVEDWGVRRVIIRTGVVLDSRGGALPKMTLPFKFFMGSPLGNGLQWIPWIHYYDEVAAIRFLIENEAAQGAFNLSAPDPVRNQEFTQLIGKAMNRPVIAPAVPSFVLKMVMGEMATIVLEGQQAVPQRLQELGFQFKYPEAESALKDLL